MIGSFLKSLWKYKTHLYLISVVAREVWKTAKDVTREYIQQLVRKKLRRQILIVSTEILLLLVAFLWVQSEESLLSRLFASLCLWGVTLYNLYDLFFVTIPELKQVHRVLRGRVGYTLKYFLKISIVTELLEWNILFLSFCFFLAFTSRTLIAASFSYLAPWVELLASL